MRLVSILLFVSFFNVCCQSNDVNPEILKINGITFDGPAEPPITKEMFSSLDSTGTRWVSTTPEAFTYRNTLEVKSFYKEMQWYGETIQGSETVTMIAKAKGYKVMMKPHMGFTYDVSNWKNKGSLDFEKKQSIINAIVENIDELKEVKDSKEFNKIARNHKKLKNHYDEIENYFKLQMEYISAQPNLTKGNWRGDFDLVNLEDWDKWEKGYEKYILNTARIADSLNVDLFCIGTELGVSATKREKFWRQLIKKVRNIYSGSLTFSANWDNYQNIKFWNELDFIGISAYFPLSEKENPNINDILEGWTQYVVELEKTSKDFDRPILFTEYGYKSVNFAAKEPWKEYVEYNVNEELQLKLYKGLYQTFWNEKWFAGGFVWKWYYNGNGGEKSYSPQDKEAERLMKEWYSQN